MKIKYKITGTITVDESVYSTECDDWKSMSAEEKTDFVKELEADCGYEAILEAAQGESNVEITEVIL